jgi:enoyl-CoA hydratase/carnithine racemase
MLDRPSRFNAFNDELYRAFPQALQDAGNDWPRTKVTMLTGNTASPWFSSGNDLTDFLSRFSNYTDIKQVLIFFFCLKYPSHREVQIVYTGGVQKVW